MSATPDIPAPTPSSEQSVYFDAPIMHFFSRNNDDKAHDEPTQVADTNGAHQGTDPQPSVAIAPDPVVNRYHENLEDEQQQLDDKKPAATTLSAIPEGSHRRAGSPPSDSGYGSSSPNTAARPPERSASRASRRSLKPVPVVWKDGQPGSETDDDTYADPGADNRARRATSMRSLRTSTSRRDRDGYDHESVRSTPASRFSDRRRRVSLSGGSFAGGAGTIGPEATPQLDDTQSFVARAKSAEAELTPKQKSKIEKASAKEGKRLSKVLKSEAKSEAKAIEQAIRELADIQKMQKTALKEESRAVASHAKALRTFHKEELEYLAARARYEKAQAELAAVEDGRDAAREHAQEVTEMMQEKSKEVDWLRAQKAADDVSCSPLHFHVRTELDKFVTVARTTGEACAINGQVITPNAPRGPQCAS
ncbi:uncharacterized protein B0H18DRAFT_252704 [Fomitopsis serialis]|uniref:uncharacterized protein n=1 Tax=Fomitopsis serialis TaxID=139415 RepID=UPI00200884E2|nr:uncharacterized protein B0H18DRAFT_252704 [Neoantrodia serialis]KAH9928262.1 hypothetical protein B0H18DRAFT_252704 [Neoantrodia serialis]